MRSSLMGKFSGPCCCGAYEDWIWCSGTSGEFRISATRNPPRLCGGMMAGCPSWRGRSAVGADNDKPRAKRSSKVKSARILTKSLLDEDERLTHINIHIPILLIQLHPTPHRALTNHHRHRQCSRREMMMAIRPHRAQHRTRRRRIEPRCTRMTPPSSNIPSSTRTRSTRTRIGIVPVLMMLRVVVPDLHRRRAGDI